MAAMLFPQATQAHQINGQAYVGLDAVAAHFGMRSYWLRGEKVYRLKSEWTQIDFETDNRLCRINEVPVYLGFTAERAGGVLCIARADVLHVLQPILTPQVFSPKPNKRRVILDAGHGGTDVGAENQSVGLFEKELTLDVVKRLARRLEALGFEVVLTRTDDRFIELADRPLLANRAQADLFISLHFNAAANHKADGFEVFTLTPQNQRSTHASRASSGDGTWLPGNRYDPWNQLLAYHLQNRLVEGIGGTSRGVKRARFAVLKGLDCPGVLAELGFVTHAETAVKLRSIEYRERLARALSDGIVDYANRLR